MRKRIISVLIIVIGLLVVFFIFNVKESRDVITTKGGTTITLWDNYLIFEDYKGVFHPKQNYIKTSKVIADFGYISITRKKDSSIVVRTDRSTIEVNLRDIYKIDILKPCKDTMRTENIYSEELVDLIIDCYAHRSHYVPKIIEYFRDSIIITEFEPNRKIFTTTSLGEEHTSWIVNPNSKLSF